MAIQIDKIEMFKEALYRNQLVYWGRIFKIA